MLFILLYHNFCYGEVFMMMLWLINPRARGSYSTLSSLFLSCCGTLKFSYEVFFLLSIDSILSRLRLSSHQSALSPVCSEVWWRFIKTDFKISGFDVRVDLPSQISEIFQIQTFFQRSRKILPNQNAAIKILQCTTPLLTNDLVCRYLRVRTLSHSHSSHGHSSHSNFAVVGDF